MDMKPTYEKIVRGRSDGHGGRCDTQVVRLNGALLCVLVREYSESMPYEVRIETKGYVECGFVNALMWEEAYGLGQAAPQDRDGEPFATWTIWGMASIRPAVADAKQDIQTWLNEQLGPMTDRQVTEVTEAKVKEEREALAKREARLAKEEREAEARHEAADTLARDTHLKDIGARLVVLNAVVLHNSRLALEPSGRCHESRELRALGATLERAGLGHLASLVSKALTAQRALFEVAGVIKGYES